MTAPVTPSPIPSGSADLVEKVLNALAQGRLSVARTGAHWRKISDDDLAQAATLIQDQGKHESLLRQSFEARGELIESDPFPLWMQVVASFDHMRARALTAERSLEEMRKQGLSSSGAGVPCPQMGNPTPGHLEEANDAFEIGSRVRPRGAEITGTILEFNADQTGGLVRWDYGDEIWKALRNLEIAPSDRSDYDLSIHTNPDAAAWAKFFCETHPGVADEGFMLGWFANAMMAMHDHLRAAPSSAKQAPGEGSRDDLKSRLDQMTKERDGLLADKARLDWLEHRTVNVRLPLVHGSRDLLSATPDDSFEGEEGPSDIRAQIDRAKLCEDCPPFGYPTDKTRCDPCPRREDTHTHSPAGGQDDG